MIQKSFKETFTKNYNNVQNEKKQKQTKNRAKINEKIPMKKKGSLTLHKYCRLKKEKKKSQME